MIDQPADNYIKSEYAICTCCQKPFKFTKKWNEDILLQEAIKIYGDTVTFEKDVHICKNCWDNLNLKEK